MIGTMDNYRGLAALYRSRDFKRWVPARRSLHSGDTGQSPPPAWTAGGIMCSRSASWGPGESGDCVREGRRAWTWVCVGPAIARRARPSAYENAHRDAPRYTYPRPTSAIQTLPPPPLASTRRRRTCASPPSRLLLLLR
ncbi:hypothetical protein GUJ93_ZPchr0003g17741 [Zizania palustris]|uniref:Uncharacterized protein n=1 Tax=Zizania palustris TaxID=103762 RepID=A0A8J5SBU0_ZIZPA|nr:hypothetical protein GUJ93_ZPchr0003g17741 [Zizania palustris]